MDYTDIGSIAGLVSLAMVVAEKIYQLINHKRIRSNCCGFKTEVSIDVENTTPPSEKTAPGSITFNEQGDPEVFSAALGKKVPYKIPLHLPTINVLTK